MKDAIAQGTCAAMPLNTSDTAFLHAMGAAPRPAGKTRILCNFLWFASLLGLAALAGCSAIGPTKMSQDAYRQTTCVAVQWTPRDQIVKYCGTDPFFGLSNQACLKDGGVIVSAKPRDWNDESAMISLGHELYHALGARHD